MTDTKELITRRLTALVGLDVSGVNHAADMLTLQFGPLRQVTTRGGTVKQVGEWALHVQCGWQIERADNILATQNDLSGPGDQVHHAAEKVHELLVTSGPTVVESVSANELGRLRLSLSNGLQLTVIPADVPDEEDWRFFEPASDAKHFVIEGGKVDPWSLS